MGNLTIKIEHKRSVYLSGFFVEKSCLKKIKKFFSIRKDLSYWSFILEAETKEDKKYYYSIIRGKRYDSVTLCQTQEFMLRRFSVLKRYESFIENI